MLHAFTCLQVPVGVRCLSRICGLHVRSTQLALEQLCEEKLISVRTINRKPQYQLNPSHPETARIRRLFQTDEQERVLHSHATGSANAWIICAFIDDALRMTTAAKEKSHAAQ